MRVLEWLLAALLVPAILWSFHPQFPLWMAWLALVAAGVFLLHCWLEGVHWQVAPIYLALGFSLLADYGVVAHPYLRIASGTLALLLLLAGLGMSCALPMFKLPTPTGPYPVGTRTLQLIDHDRTEMHSWAEPGPREVVVQLWYPAIKKGRKAAYRRRKETTPLSSYQAVLWTHSIQDAPIADGAFPIIVHNPGWHGWRQRGTFMTQELASQGFVVVGVSHPYNSSFVQLSTGKVVHPDHTADIGFSTKRLIPYAERLQLIEAELAIHTKDCRFVLDVLEKRNQTPGDFFESHLQIDRVGGYGYSFGGAVSAELAKEDPRVRSALGLDGVLHGAAARGLDKPLMLIDAPWMVNPMAPENHWLFSMVKPDKPWHELANADTKIMWTTISDDKLGVLARCGGFRVLMKGIGHEDFTDHVFMSPFRRLSGIGSIKSDRLAVILDTYVTAFFKQTLMDIPAPILTQGNNPFPEATIEVWPTHPAGT